MRILIVEDEPAAARRLQKIILELVPKATIVGVCESVQESVNWLKTNIHPDLFLFDIQLADGLSFEIFTQVATQVPVIFATAYDEYALRAFKVNSIDYLLKPIDREALRLSIEKFNKLQAGFASPAMDIQTILAQMISGKPIYKTRFLVSKGMHLIPIDHSEVAWLRTEERIVFLHTHDGKRYLTEHTLDELEELLDPTLFFRANRQYLISTRAVHHVVPGVNGKLNLFLHPQTEEEVVVSREKAMAFRRWLEQ
jgi:two-component system, LytTR family, response regulator LytT